MEILTYLGLTDKIFYVAFDVYKKAHTCHSLAAGLDWPEGRGPRVCALDGRSHGTIDIPLVYL